MFLSAVALASHAASFLSFQSQGTLKAFLFGILFGVCERQVQQRLLHRKASTKVRTVYHRTSKINNQDTRCFSQISPIS